jgi:hypothetical protein
MFYENRPLRAQLHNEDRHDIAWRSCNDESALLHT